MATDPSNHPRKRTTTFSPRRGRWRVKAQIFGSLAAEISSLASTIWKVFFRPKRGGDGVTASASAATSTTASSSTSTSTTASAAITQPPSSYASDGDHDHA